MSEELEQLKKEYHSWDHSKAGDRYIERLWSVGDKLQVQVDELNRELHIADKQLEALTEENKQLREKAQMYDEVEFLVIEINGKPENIIHLHDLLQVNQKIEAILDVATNYTCWKDAEEMSKKILEVFDK